MPGYVGGGRPFFGSSLNCAGEFRQKLLPLRLCFSAVSQSIAVQHRGAVHYPLFVVNLGNVMIP